LYHFEYNFYICNSYILTTCVFPNTAIELVCNRNEDFFFYKGKLQRGLAYPHFHFLVTEVGHPRSKAKLVVDVMLINLYVAYCV
jgi:hypothetical protein